MFLYWIIYGLFIDEKSNLFRLGHVRFECDDLDLIAKHQQRKFHGKVKSIAATTGVNDQADPTLIDKMCARMPACIS